jgi:4-amino-4-deoxy-L-arabinose transferase-like glycosyltransferase
LFGALFLVNYDFRRWLKFYIPAAGVFMLQLLTVFRLGTGGGTTSIFYAATGLLAAALTALFLARKESRIPCTFGLVLLMGAIIACFFGISIPTVYFDRIAWFVLILSLPFLIRAITPSLIKKLTFPTTVFALAFSAVLICTHAVSVVDNPSVYQKLPGEVTQKLEGGYTRYSTDGSALYLLPLDNVKFSNSGQEKHEQFTENVTTYRMQIERENASYILVYGESSEENLIHELNYELVYSTDNLKIYRTHLAPPYP